MHRYHSFLPSGRLAMWKFVPILSISPVLSIFVPQWDLPIYLCVIYTFTLVIVIAFRRICNDWTSWHLKIPCFTEKEMIQWFRGQFPDQLDKSDATLMAAARVALKAKIRQIQDQEHFWRLGSRKSQVDEFVGPIAHNQRFFECLLILHSDCSEIPELFSPTWFVQIDLAMKNKRQMMRGLKEHSAFIHYRYSRYDVS